MELQMAFPFRISAKNLGALALANFCPRCFWIKARCGNKLPYQIFPGIFSSIDSYTKVIIHGWFDRHKAAPPWLAELGKIKTYRDPPHYSKFKALIEDGSVQVWGSPDAVFVRQDDSTLIADYKTAKFSESQDVLFPMYEAQLNAYAYIGERCGLSPVTALALIYTEPVTSERAAACDEQTLRDGFRMDFAAKILLVKIDSSMTPQLCRQAKIIYDLEASPDSRPGCKDCELLESLIQVASR